MASGELREKPKAPAGSQQNPALTRWAKVCHAYGVEKKERAASEGGPYMTKADEPMAAKIRGGVRR